MGAVTLLLACALPAQNTALHITVVSGEGAVYSAGAHVTKPLTIEVTDANGKPVEGARASFQLPEEGPGGIFSSGLRTDLAITDSNGRATLRGIQLNRTSGSYTVRITAAKEQARAGIVVRQGIGGLKDTIESADRKALRPATASAPPPAPSAATTSAAAADDPPANAAPVNAAPANAAPVNAGQAPPRPKTVIVTASAGVAPPRPARVPTIVITQKTPRPAGQPSAGDGHRPHKKWIWLGMMAAGGVAGAFAGQKLGTASAHGSAGVAAGTTSAISIGTPTITIGKP